MDNFAVTLAAGTTCKTPKLRIVLWVSFLFALAHFIMFCGGWFLGRTLGSFIHAIDHWIAFAILCVIGLHMLKEARSAQAHSSIENLNSFKTCLLLAAATSVDAWMIGMGLSFTAAPFWLTAQMMVGCVFVTSWAGFKLGAWMGQKLGAAAEITGGILLILIGVKLLLEGMGIW